MGNTYEDIGNVTHSIQANEKIFPKLLITLDTEKLGMSFQIIQQHGNEKIFPKLLITLDTEKLGMSFQIIQQRLARL